MSKLIINNVDNFVQPIKLYHPDDPRYFNYWLGEKKKVIEGLWAYDERGWRYMPPKLYFFGNHGWITLVDEKQNVTVGARPELWDLMWMYGYESFESLGFSGFKDDEKNTCNKYILEYSRTSANRFPTENFFKPDGTLKNYVDAKEYMYSLHDKSYGVPLYENAPQNYLVGGSRGGGKSFWLGIGEALHEIVTDGVKYYTPENIKSPPTIKVVIGSGDTSKSSELVSKVKDGMDAFANRPELGAWGDISDEDYEPSPFYKNMVGDLTPNNIDNPWRHEYKALVKGREITKGTKTRLHHVSYSEMKGKKKGGQAAAGTRTTLSIIEEGGLTSLLEDAYKSNDATIRIGTRYFGRMVFAGTSENIEVVQPFKTLFSRPKQYRILARPDTYENSGTDIAMFLPCYLTDRTFKDRNGNTRIEEAIDYYKQIRVEKSKAEDPDLLRKEKMNYPLVPSEMWLSNKGSYLPSEELSIREKQLITNSYYSTLETCVKLYWDSTKPRGVGYEILHDGEPYRSFPHDEGKLRNPEGCVVIYDFPQEINGQIPPDLYSFIGHDPHGDGKEPGSSVASTYIVMNPKYAGSPYNLRGNCIVAAYNGKPKGGLDEYYEIQERLISLYGNPPMGLMYERNKGADCRAHYIKKHKLHLLAPTPQFGAGTSMDFKTIRDFGYYTGATNFGKPSMAKHIHDWLLEWTELSDNLLEGGKKQNWERIPDLYLIRQMMQYDLEGNFDAVDGFRGCVLALREYQIKLQSDTRDKAKPTTTFQGILNNNRIFQRRLNATKT